jgi:hypothetical protein
VADQKRKGLSFDAVLSLLLFVGVAAHVGGLWEIPQLAEPSSAPSASFDARAITLAYSRLVTGGASPWDREDLDKIMRRFVERWSEATLSRSRIVVMPETELRDVLVVFNNKRVTPPAEARSVTYASGRLRYIEVYSEALVLGVDVEYTANTLLHELAHALGCCSGPGTSGGHWVSIGPLCTRILCSPHGSARTFSEEEMSQIGLGR